MKYLDVKLDKDDKLNLLKAIDGLFCLSTVSNYMLESQYPKFVTDPFYLYISHALNIEWEEIVNDTDLQEVCKQNKDKIKEKFKKCWSKPEDQLYQILCDFTSDYSVDESLIEKLDSSLKEYYDFVISFKKYHYEKTDSQIYWDGEWHHLYIRKLK
jgi:hypothetical protein